MLRLPLVPELEAAGHLGNEKKGEGASVCIDRPSSHTFLSGCIFSSLDGKGTLRCSVYASNGLGAIESMRFRSGVRGCGGGVGECRRGSAPHTPVSTLSSQDKLADELEADASKRISFLEQEVVPHREQIARGGRTAKRTLTVHNAAGQKAEQSKSVLWPDYV